MTWLEPFPCAIGLSPITIAAENDNRRSCLNTKDYDRC